MPNSCFTDPLVSGGSAIQSRHLVCEFQSLGQALQIAVNAEIVDPEQEKFITSRKRPLRSARQACQLSYAQLMVHGSVSVGRFCDPVKAPCMRISISWTSSPDRRKC